MRYFSRFAVATMLAVCSASAVAGLMDFLPKVNIGGRSVDLGGVAKDVGEGFTETTEADEIRMGQDFASTLLGAKPLVADAALQRYVNTLGRWLASQTERPDLPWTFGVLDDPGFNAFATPGGYIFVTQGLLNRMSNEAELAGVLAHEIGHVLKKHHLNAVKKNGKAKFFLRGVDAAIKGNDQAKSFALNSVKNLYSKGLDKDDEFEADQIGVVIAARAGYDAYGLPSVLQMLQAQKAEEDDFTLMFETHPSPSARIEMLGKLMNTQFDTLPASTGRSLNVRLTEFGKK